MKKGLTRLNPQRLSKDKFREEPGRVLDHSKSVVGELKILEKKEKKSKEISQIKWPVMEG
jgi:hypothetical protein